MRKRVPLNAIRAFEAVARNTSVARAADELCVTPTAVSHQIRLLEEFLQVELFVRKNSRIYPTPDAVANMTRVSQALDLIDEAVASLGAVRDDSHLRLAVSAPASLASLWLVPRLGHFLACEPDVDLSLRTFLNRRDAESQDTDIRICPWAEGVSGLHSEPLVEEASVPVCAPELLARYDGDRAETLRRAPLIHVDRAPSGYEGDYPDWARYIGEYGAIRRDVGHGLRFNQSSQAVEAALSGVGVLLGRSLLIQKALEDGRLVPVAETFPARVPYYLQSPYNSKSRQMLQKFKDWLFENVRTAPIAVAA
ncbi:LysR family transcriptional regulator, glycine cleavage system transcriptional activator [Thalassovita litoralis]|jgi:LysR family glycine cleavage system transcriptional activator|uniref:LysR family transcriptional regulator, glycine cleavage system transcriptional activator n=1 Tax=Thalassovita litoralis TaxID=1010611 RepID=A0A521C470_9RHOB|nr:LysR substrate-binding domain-containing protein [Thalassovita litoralis]SMO54193.1 LysR family transcriptional regulator, glycine cleavage system transcriptional activator [Thalassovita litoralis]